MRDGCHWSAVLTDLTVLQPYIGKDWSYSQGERLTFRMDAPGALQVAALGLLRILQIVVWYSVLNCQTDSMEHKAFLPSSWFTHSPQSDQPCRRVRRVPRGPLVPIYDVRDVHIVNALQWSWGPPSLAGGRYRCMTCQNSGWRLQLGPLTENPRTRTAVTCRP